jgi:hypothetical protein
VVRGVPKRRAARRQRRQVRRAERPEPHSRCGRNVRSHSSRCAPATSVPSPREHRRPGSSTRVRLLAAPQPAASPDRRFRRGLPFHPRARPFQEAKRSGLRRPRGARCFPVRGQASRRRRPPQRAVPRPVTPPVPACPDRESETPHAPALTERRNAPPFPSSTCSPLDRPGCRGPSSSILPEGPFAVPISTMDWLVSRESPAVRFGAARSPPAPPKDIELRKARQGLATDPYLRDAASASARAPAGAPRHPLRRRSLADPVSPRPGLRCLPAGARAGR